MGQEPQDNRPTALVLLGHGTRHPAGRDAFLETRQHLATLLPGTAVRHAYLGARAPDLLSQLDQLTAQGFRDIWVAPLLLLAAGHMNRDIPRLLAAFRRRRPQVRVHCLPVLGAHDQIIALMARSARQVIRSAAAAPDATCLLVAGHGSPGGQTTGELRHIAQRVASQLGVAGWRIGLLAMAEPALDRVLAEVVQLPYLWVVVQPHLLFEGALSERLRGKIKEQDGDRRRQRLLLGAPLGGGAPLAQVVADRFCERNA